jgi:hypothetical protein
VYVFVLAHKASSQWADFFSSAVKEVTAKVEDIKVSSWGAIDEFIPNDGDYRMTTLFLSGQTRRLARKAKKKLERR